MPSDATIGYLVDKLDVLRVECPMCDRQGRYQVERLIAERAPNARLTDFLNELTADCPQRSQRGVSRACGAIMPDLKILP